MKARRIRAATCAAVATVMTVAPGCGTILYGGWETVDIRCSQSKAVVAVDGKPIRQGPVRLRRGDHHNVHCEAEGFRATGAYISNDLKWWVLLIDVFGLGIVGVIPDAVLGSWYGLVPASVSVSMDPDPSVHATATPSDRVECECGFLMKPDVPCPNCGRVGEAAPPATPAPSGAPSETRPAAGSKFCGSCGAKVPPGTAFCPSCGARQ